MGFNFRKRIKVGSGGISFSKSGVNVSTGSTSVRWTKGRKKGGSGCLTSVGFLFLAMIALAFIATYGGFLLIVAAVALAAFLIFLLVRFLLNRNAGDTEQKSEIATLLQEKNNAFQAELDAIPLAEVSVSEPAKKQYLKDIPEWSTSNITRSTRNDNIFPLVVLDVETTGLRPSSDEIIEVSAIKFDRGMTPVAAFTTLCKPTKPIPETSTAIHHITEEMVSDAPGFRQIAQALTEFLADSNLAGHNLDFDLRFIWAYGVQFPEEKRFYDTLDLAHLTISRREVLDYKLDTLCDYYGIHRSNAHRSLSDAYATSKLFSHLVYDKTTRQLDAQAKAVET